MPEDRALQPGAIAIVGMAGRFPRARNVDELWENLRDGRECISRFDEAQLLELGVSQQMIADPRCVPAQGIVDDIDMFDAALFGMTPREAQMMDPQLRVFLEVAWEALENAGRCGDDVDRVGVYAGGGLNSYLWTNVMPALEDDSLSFLQAKMTNDKDFLTTWVSYKLGLTGPSVAVQTACSTSLVATHLACSALRTGDCDVVLAGGVSISTRQMYTYLYAPGGIQSPDGRCRPFDAGAAGIVRGAGAAVVVLMRLEDAMADGHTIRGVILGSAINNDGSMKIGFTAPGVEGQAEVITAALRDARVEAETIGYVEAHGTGTPLGDPIEIAALTQAFDSSRRGFCAVGSVKANIGHLDAAAGVTGLIKAVLSLEHECVPPTANFESPNPLLRLETTPFFVSGDPLAWPRGAAPRRAGVSSFGIGGTNAHVVLQEAPSIDRAPGSPGEPRLLVLSARTEPALDQLSARLAAFLESHPETDLDDMAFTLQVGRRPLEVRRALVCKDVASAATLLKTESPARVAESSERPLVFVFPGQGTQRAGMARGLYESDSSFRATVDSLSEALRDLIDIDAREWLYPDRFEPRPTELTLEDTLVAQPLLFTVQVALARYWMNRDVYPQALIGHSIGELTAACIAGVFSDESALALVAERARLMQEQPRGAMLAVNASASDVHRMLTSAGMPPLDIAVVNTYDTCVVSGSSTAIDDAAPLFEARGLTPRRVPTSHAFHSAMMESAVAPFVQAVDRVPRARPEIPFGSNVDGRWIDAQTATEPAYWGRHIRQRVRFADNVSEAIALGNTVFVELGTGGTLAFLRRHPMRTPGHVFLSSLPDARSTVPEAEHVLTTLGELWCEGISPDWTTLPDVTRCRRIPLPAYPFERKRYWLDPPGTAEKIGNSARVDAGMDEHRLEDPDEQMAQPITDRVLTLWRTVFANDEIERSDNFFDLGGESLLAAQLVNRIRDEFHVDVPVSALFDMETVGEFADAVSARFEEARQGADELNVSRIDAEPASMPTGV